MVMIMMSSSVRRRWRKRSLQKVESTPWQSANFILEDETVERQQLNLPLQSQLDAPDWNSKSIMTKYITIWQSLESSLEAQPLSCGCYCLHSLMHSIVMCQIQKDNRPRTWLVDCNVAVHKRCFVSQLTKYISFKQWPTWWVDCTQIREDRGHGAGVINDTLHCRSNLVGVCSAECCS